MYKVKKINWIYGIKTLVTYTCRLNVLVPYRYLLKSFLPAKAPVGKVGKIKKILIMRNDRIGDLVVTTGFIRTLAEAGFEVYVSSRAISLQVLKNNPHVKEVFVYEDKSYKQIKDTLNRVNKYSYDLAIDVQYNSGIAIRQTYFSSKVNCRYLIGFSKSSIASYNISIPWYKTDSHVTEQFKSALQEIYRLWKDTNSLPSSFLKPDLSYEVFDDPEAEEQAEVFIKEVCRDQKPLVLLNPFGSDPKGTRSRKCLTIEQINFIVSRLRDRFNIALIGESKYLKDIKLDENIPIYKSPTLSSLYSIIKKAYFLVTVDTAAAHLAACYAKKSLVYYLEFPKLIESYPNNLLFNLTAKVQSKEGLAERYYNDGAYMREHNQAPTEWSSSAAWKPLNRNAVSLVFNSQSLSIVDFDYFKNQTIAALEKVLG